MHRWGYAPTLTVLADELLGGSANPAELEQALGLQGRVHIGSGFVSLAGSEDLVTRSSERVASHAGLNGDGWRIALQFAEELVQFCPFVRCLAVSGSLASGGFDPSDDIDFDVFARAGTKYATYLLSTLLGLKYSWRHRHRLLSNKHRVGSIPKLICINVIWAEDETKPFVRQDADLAFELLRCQPLFGTDFFREVCDRNKWVRTFFPQLYTRALEDRITLRESGLRRLLARVAPHRIVMKAIESSSRGVVWSLYQLVRWLRRNDSGAVSRMDFLRKAKWPYEILQD